MLHRKDLLQALLAIASTTIIHSMDRPLDDLIKDWQTAIHHPQLTAQTQDSSGNTILHHLFASSKMGYTGASLPDDNNPRMVALRTLLEKGASFTMQNHVGDTPLHVGARKKNFELFSYCFARQYINPKQLNMINEEVFTPLDIAWQQRPPHEKMIVELIQQGALKVAPVCPAQCYVYDEQIVQDFAIVKELHTSAVGGDFEAIQKVFAKTPLLFHSLYLPIQHSLLTFVCPEYKGINLINSAARGIEYPFTNHRRAEIVQFLLSLKMQSNLVDEDGNLPIHRAAEYGNYDVLEQLLAYNASGINNPNSCGRTPLHLITLVNVINFEHKSVAKSISLLLTYGAHINQQDSEGKTPLLIAIKEGNLPVVELLLKRGARGDIADHEKNYPLHCAASGESNFSDTMFSLLMESANDTLLDAKNKFDRTPAQEIEIGLTIKRYWNWFERNDRCKKNKALLQQYWDAKGRR